MAEEYAGVLTEARNLIETYRKPEFQRIEEPGTGMNALVTIDKDGVHAVDDSVFAPYRSHPKRREGTATFTKVESLIDHVNRFKNEDSALFACDNRSTPSIAAVLDYHDAVNDENGEATPLDPKPRFGSHRSLFRFPLSDEWAAWNGSNAKPMSMSGFASFLEDRIVDVLDPDAGGGLGEELQRFIALCGGKIASPAKLIELSRGLQVFENSVVGEMTKLSSGEAQIEFKSEHVDAKGKPLNVPGLFLIAIPVFKHGERFRIAARLRYRKTAEGIVFWYELWRAEQVFDTAFSEACEVVRSKTGLPLFYGSPE